LRWQDLHQVPINPDCVLTRRSCQKLGEIRLLIGQQL
jgi:hypothetical protein